MKNRVEVTPFFERRYKRLSKKFTDLADSLRVLENQLIENPRTGIDLGENIYKIRLGSKSKGRGKSGGFRVFTYLVEEAKEGLIIKLITIFDKSEESTITKKDIKAIIKKIFGDEDTRV